jgi:hypothetical protein
MDTIVKVALGFAALALVGVFMSGGNSAPRSCTEARVQF